MEVKTVGVIGAGAMGRGIAYAAAFGGYKTVLEDISPRVLEQATGWIRQSFDEGVSRGKVETGIRDKALHSRRRIPADELLRKYVEQGRLGRKTGHGV